MSDTKEIKTEKINEPEVNNELSQVASSPTKNIAILGIITAIFVIIFYNMFIVDLRKPKPTETPKPLESQIVKPNADPSDLPEIPQLPEPPKLVEPTSPPPLPEIPTPEPIQPAPLPMPEPAAVPTLPDDPPSNGILTGSSDDAMRRKEAKRKSAIIVKDDTGRVQKPDNSVVSQIKSLEYMLGRGKIIDAVLESAISTDFGGEVRAVISRDVFSESGKVILIPKGSRVFGTYATGIQGTYGRIEIIWDRIDLASGYRLNLLGYAIDNLGRKGIQGRVDNKYTEIMANAVLTSAFNIMVANAVDKIVLPPGTSEQATKSQAESTAIQSSAVAILADASKTYVDLCTAIQSSISDKTSSAYQQAVSECTRIGSNGTTTPAQKKQEAANLATTIATSILSTSVTSTTPSKAQKAAEDAFKHITDTLKGIVDKQQFQPTITIDQGKPVKIYVTKDYEFPKEAVFKSRLIQ